MIPRSKSSGHQEEMVMEAIESAIIVEAMIIYHMIAPSPTSECQEKNDEDDKDAKYYKKSSTKKKNHQTSPTKRRRVNIVLSWSING
jgi:DUF438 domain-containing protein